MLDRGAGVRRLPHLLDQRRERIDHAIALVPDQRRERALLVAKELVQGLLGNCRDRSQVVRGRADVAVVDEHVNCALKALTPTPTTGSGSTTKIRFLKTGDTEVVAVAQSSTLAMSVWVKSLPLNSSGTLRCLASAYEKQSP